MFYDVIVISIDNKFNKHVLAIKNLLELKLV